MAFIPPALWNFPPRVAIGKNLLVVVVLSQLAASPGSGGARLILLGHMVSTNIQGLGLSDELCGYGYVVRGRLRPVCADPYRHTPAKRL